MERNNKVLAGLMSIAAFILLVFYVPKIFEEGIPVICIEDGSCQHEAYLESVIAYLPLMIVAGFVFGVIVSFLYFERKLDVPAPPKDRDLILLSMLQPSERKVMGKIISNGGKALQSELSRIEGVGKVKAHRVIERLMRRGVLEKEQMGKTNILHLRKDLKEVFGQEGQ